MPRRPPRERPSAAPRCRSWPCRLPPPGNANVEVDKKYQVDKGNVIITADRGRAKTDTLRPRQEPVDDSGAEEQRFGIGRQEPGEAVGVPERQCPGLAQAAL